MKDESKRFLERRANAELDVSFRRSSPKPREAPRTEAELEARARDLAGLTVRELAERMGLTLPPSSARGKGFAGTLAELALGADAGNRSEPDFIELRVELKTIPLDSRGRPSRRPSSAPSRSPTSSSSNSKTLPCITSSAASSFCPSKGRPSLPIAASALVFFIRPMKASSPSSAAIGSFSENSSPTKSLKRSTAPSAKSCRSVPKVETPKIACSARFRTTGSIMRAPSAFT